MLFLRPRARGRFVMIPFHSPDRGEKGAARRGLAVFLASLSAQSIVIALDRRYLLIHQTEPKRAPEVLRKIEAQ